MYSMYITQLLNIRGLFFSFALIFTPAWCEVHIAHCTIASPPMLYTHLPCPLSSYWRTKAS